MLYQQGDVLIETVDSIPEEAVSELAGERGFILAAGEVTGHAHTINPRGATLMGHNGQRFLKVYANSATVKHEEHGHVKLPKGDYKIRIVKEYDHFAEEARSVKD